MSHQDNIKKIKTVFDTLEELQDQVVFVGGATVSLYDQTEALEVRETKDVDVIIEITKYSEQGGFEEQLRAKGFVDDVKSPVRGRFKIKGIIVDVMPTSDLHMGFENKWYPEGYKNAIEYVIDKNTTIKILSAPYFIATKLEAFKNRGRKDGRMSHDFEDIVHVFEYRLDIWEEMKQTNKNLRRYLQDEFKALKSNSNIREWIDCHADFGSPPPTDNILYELEKFIKG